MRIGVAPSVSVVCPASRLTWLVVRRAMRPGALAEQQDEQPGDAVAGVVAVVVQEAAGQCPPVILGERDHRVRAER